MALKVCRKSGGEFTVWLGRSKWGGLRASGRTSELVGARERAENSSRECRTLAGRVLLSSPHAPPGLLGEPYSLHEPEVTFQLVVPKNGLVRTTH